MRHNNEGDGITGLLQPRLGAMDHLTVDFDCHLSHSATEVLDGLHAVFILGDATRGAAPNGSSPVATWLTIPDDKHPTRRSQSG